MVCAAARGRATRRRPLTTARGPRRAQIAARRYWFFVAANSEACYLRAFDLVYQRQRARLYKMAGFVTADDESPVSAAGPGAARQKQSPSSDADATT